MGMLWMRICSFPKKDNYLHSGFASWCLNWKEIIPFSSQTKILNHVQIKNGFERHLFYQTTYSDSLRIRGNKVRLEALLSLHLTETWFH